MEIFDKIRQIIWNIAYATLLVLMTILLIKVIIKAILLT